MEASLKARSPDTVPRHYPALLAQSSPIALPTHQNRNTPPSQRARAPAADPTKAHFPLKKMRTTLPSRGMALRAPRPFRASRSLVPTRAASKGSPPPPTKPPRPDTDAVAEVDRMLQELNINKATAKQVLKVWRTAGIADPEALRRALVKRGANRSAAVAGQLAVDASAAAVAFYSGTNIATSRALGSFTLAAEFLCYALACYLSISATLDVFALVAVGLATKRYSTSSAAFLEAVQALAGPESGLDVVDKARKAVSTVRVLQALDAILARLKARAGDAAGEDNFLRDLGAYVTLLRAAEAGFDPGAVGVDRGEAAAIAAEFAAVDADDDGRIDRLEFKRLATRLAPGVSDDEAEAAMAMIDANADGSVDFREFVTWWTAVGSKSMDQA